MDELTVCDEWVCQLQGGYARCRYGISDDHSSARSGQRSVRLCRRGQGCSPS
ncbi:hypothetical protein JCM18918_146 [Cutibacterium acnes JCM 18918]|nr:hypothetical protein JCM18918_146 [Cutibacterium acnes JCM 18918]